jgi:hypothetical protein
MSAISNFKPKVRVIEPIKEFKPLKELVVFEDIVYFGRSRLDQQQNYRWLYLCTKNDYSKKQTYLYNSIIGVMSEVFLQFIEDVKTASLKSYKNGYVSLGKVVTVPAGDSLYTVAKVLEDYGIVQCEAVPKSYFFKDSSANEIWVPGINFKAFYDSLKPIEESSEMPRRI